MNVDFKLCRGVGSEGCNNNSAMLMRTNCIDILFCIISLLLVVYTLLDNYMHSHIVFLVCQTTTCM